MMSQAISFSQRLNQATDAAHSALEKQVAQYAPFSSREHFAKFVQMQYLFQADLTALYHNTELAKIVPNLAKRHRLEQAANDLNDLQTSLPVAQHALDLSQASTAEALAWLFTSEGSKLGAAFLFKKAQALGFDANFAARHLAEDAEGRGKSWRNFVALIDSLEFSEEQIVKAEQAAVAAFMRVSEHLGQSFADK